MSACQTLAMDAVLSIPLTIRDKVGAAGTQVEGHEGNLPGNPESTNVGLTA